MDWLPVAGLIVSIVSLLLGGGIFVRLVQLAAKWGKLEEKVAANERQLRTDRTEIGKIKENTSRIESVPASIKSAVATAVAEATKDVSSLRETISQRMEQKVKDCEEGTSDKFKEVFNRLTSLGNDTAANKQNVQTFLRDTEQLLSDVRELVRDSASTETHIDNIRRQVEKLETSCSDLQQSVARLEARGGNGGNHGGPHQ